MLASAPILIDAAQRTYYLPAERYFPITSFEQPPSPQALMNDASDFPLFIIFLLSYRSYITNPTLHFLPIH